MEVISTVDIKTSLWGENLQYSVPLGCESLLVAHGRKIEITSGNKQKRQVGAADQIHPFNNWMTISHKDIQVIHGIINYLDSKNTLTLGFPSNQKYLKDEGKKIEHVHPLCFIWSIVNHPEMREKLRHFRDNSAFSLKWDGFLGYSTFHDKGFGKNMEKYYNHRDFSEYCGEFEAFYRALNLRSEFMNEYASSKHWKEFASALIEPSSYL